MNDWKMVALADFINDINASYPLSKKQQSDIVSWMTAMSKSGIETKAIKATIITWVKDKIVWGHIGEVTDDEQ